MCRGDFKLEDGDIYIEYNDNVYLGREYANKLLKPLIKAGLVKLERLRCLENRRYTTWYHHCPEFDINSLVSTYNFAYAHWLLDIKQTLNLPDGFDKRNKTYGDITFLYNGYGYSFVYKGEANLYFWEYVNYGGERKLFYDTTNYESEFKDLLVNIKHSIKYDRNKNEKS